MANLPQAAWWTVRSAQNTKPTTYRCPFCDRHLTALAPHMLIAPEGDTRLRRHAHTDCVLRARAAGRLPLRDEVVAKRPSLWRRLRGR